MLKQTILMVGLLTSTCALAEDSLVEVPVKRVFFPSTGASIKGVVEGDLPDLCYTVKNQTVSVGANGVISIREYATRNQNPACLVGDLLPSGTYLQEVDLSHLKPGSYSVEHFPNEDSVPAYSKVNVASVRAFETQYASVTSVRVAPLNLEGHPVQVKIEGYMSSVCSKLKTPVVVEKQQNVFMIYPIEHEQQLCAEQVKKFQKTITLGYLAPGEYLIQVQTKGSPINRRLSVMSTL